MTKRMMSYAMFKIEVFKREFGPSKYTSLKATLQNATPKWEWRRHLKSSIIYPPQELINGWHWHYKKWSCMVDSWFFKLHWKHAPYNSCTSLIWILHFISIFIDWRLGFEPTLQLKGWILKTLQNESHTRLQSWTLIICLLKNPTNYRILKSV
jgi:hypothetical protein